jgi:VanZ family protein
MLKTTSTRLFAALFGYITLIILLLTLNPFYIRLPTHIAFRWESDWRNLLSNILLFLPIGFLYRLTTKRRGVLWLGAGISLTIEILQLFIPARTPSVVDILANTLGAGFGAYLSDVISKQIEITSGLVNQLRLETPLMGTTYLLVPLLWIDTLTWNQLPYRWMLTTLIAICGSIIFSDLFRHWWSTINSRVVIFSSLTTGLWFFIGVGSNLISSYLIIGIGLGAMFLCALLTGFRRTIKDRRFEKSTLQRLFPIFGFYILLLTLWFPSSVTGHWHVFFGFTNRVTETSMQALYPRLEYLVAFTILGYLLAEWRGRQELPLSKDLPHLFVIILGTTLCLEFLSGFQSGRGASVVRLILTIVSALFGGIIYHLSREHIRFLLGR